MKYLFFIMIATALSSCSFASLDGKTNGMGAQLDATIKNTVDSTTNTVKTVERKVQQGKEVLDAVEETKKKIDAFKNE